MSAYRVVVRLERSTPVAGRWVSVYATVVQHYRDREHAASAARVAAQVATAKLTLADELAAGNDS